MKLIIFDTLLQPQLKLDAFSLVVATFFEKAVLTTIEKIISKVSATMHRTINETVVLTGWHIRIIKKNLDHDYLQVQHFDNDFSPRIR